MEVIKGYKVLPEWLRKAFKRAVSYKCQRCGVGEGAGAEGTLEIHRLKRGNKGGLYTVVPLNHKDNNVKVCCKSCHGYFHANDNRRIKSK